MHGMHVRINVCINVGSVCLGVAGGTTKPGEDYSNELTRDAEKKKSCAALGHKPLIDPLDTLNVR